MSGTEPAGSPENRGEARRWIAIAQEDIEVALAVARLAQPRTGVSAYHLQQAAEKLLKALLVLNGIPFRHTHDIDQLADHLAAIYPELSAATEPFRPLTSWNVAFRYPGLEELHGGPPAVAEVERLVAALSAFAAEARARVGGA